MGLDLGPSSIAIVAEGEARLEPFCAGVAPDTRALRRLDRQLDRQRRANNPTNDDERGRVKPVKQRWKVSKRQRKVQARRREMHRKLAATRKRSHGHLAHRVLALGDAFQPLAPLLPRRASVLWALGRAVRAGAVCLHPLPRAS